MIGALLTLAVAICCHMLVWRPQKKKSPQKKKRTLTLRIGEIPTHISRETLQCDLESLVKQDPFSKDAITVMQVFLVQRNQKTACATATFHTSLPTNEVTEKSHQAATSLPYRFDDKFDGITPLYEASGGADVE